MGKYDTKREPAGRSNANVEKAYRQVSDGSGAPRKRPTQQQIESRKRAAKKRKLTLIVVCAVVLAILVGLIVGLIISANGPKDDGRILSNVYAGGVNLGGMTMDEAKNALHLATDNALLKKDMVIKLPGTSFSLSPKDTGIKLNVDAVVQTAYNYGRTGTETEQKAIRKNASNTSHTIALLPYLNLDLPYIQKSIHDFCGSYSSVMTQPTAILQGDRPAYDPEYPELTAIHQTLVITMGKPDYALDADTIYDKVLDAYSLNELSVSYQPPAATEPDKLDAAKLFAQLCLAPADAVMDDITFEVTPEVYGYGFDIPAVQKLIDNAEYGQVIQVKLDFIMPNITAMDLTEDLFKDTLSSYASINNGANSDNRNVNLQLSCDAINGYVIKAGEEFSFNKVVGRPTAAKGYKKAPGYLSGKEAEILASGIDQTASTLYYCALMADLDILERHSNGYAVSYIGLGLDTCIDWGTRDLRLRNNTNSPIRITAFAENGQVYIQLLGTDEKDYDVELKAETINQYDPITTYHVVDKNNILGYKNGDVLQTGITGYDVELYLYRHDKQTGEVISSRLVDTSIYNKRDQIVVYIGSDAPIVEPTDPTDPSNPTDVTEPSDENLFTDIMDFIGDIF